MNATELKEQLQLIQSKNFAADEVKHPYELALHMLQHIGSTDPVLRDELIYVTFATWIGQGYFQQNNSACCSIKQWTISIFSMGSERMGWTVYLPGPFPSCCCLPS